MKVTPARSTCQELQTMTVGTSVMICGWVLDDVKSTVLLRDCTGCAEIYLEEVVPPMQTPLQTGDAIRVAGMLVKKNDRSIVQAKSIDVINRAEQCDLDRTPPLRFRDPDQLQCLRDCNVIESMARSFLSAHGLVEIRTPVLWRSVLEYGEHELRIENSQTGHAQVLLQSPLVPSLISAIGGVERSFQFARCFRTEADIDPSKLQEFMHLNITLSFASNSDGIRLIESLIRELFARICTVDLSPPFPCISYADAMHLYGTDAPDFRFPDHLLLELDESFVINSRYPEPSCAIIPGRLPDHILRVAVQFIRKQAIELAVVVCENRRSEVAFGELALADDFLMRLPTEAVSFPATAIVMLESRQRTLPIVKQLREHLYRALCEDVPLHAFLWVKEFPFLYEDEIDECVGHRSRSVFGRVIESTRDLPAPLSMQVDLIHNGVEILSCGEKEHIAQRFEENARLAGISDASDTYDYYLDALRSGAPPLFNAALGWDRLVQKLLGTSDFERHILFPTDSQGNSRLLERTRTLNAGEVT
jgi:aspartyl-tRNA synthetase